MLKLLRALRNRLLAPVLCELRELEARSNATHLARLDRIEATLLARIAASDQARDALIERVFLPIFLEKTCVKTMLAETDEGSFFFDVRDDIVGRYIAQGGWEAIETAWIKTVVRDGDCVIDGGANLGWYTVVAARLVGAGGRVLAFEPDPHNFGLLERNVTENRVADRCTLLPIALLDHAGVCSLERSPDNYGDHRVRFASPVESNENKFNEDKRAEISVSCDSLDNAVRQAGLAEKPIRLLKLDTQGSEIAILKGAMDTLARTEYLISEYWPYAIARSGYSAGDFEACVTGRFSEFCRVTEGKFAFQPIDRLHDDLSQPMTTHTGADAYTMYIFRRTAAD